jgi:hypothetical protein
MMDHHAQGQIASDTINASDPALTVRKSYPAHPIYKSGRQQRQQ